MRLAKKLAALLQNIVELYVPAASFVLMFVVFVLQIFCRYVLNQPLDWAYEVTVSCYLWMVVLGACYALRWRSHVVFTLLYDKLPPRFKALTSFLGNGLIAFAFAWSFWPSVQMIEFMKMQKTSILRIGLNIVYAPYIPFMILVFTYMVIDMVRDFRVFAGLASGEEVEKMLQENRSETQEAIDAARECDPL